MPPDASPPGPRARPEDEALPLIGGLAKVVDAHRRPLLEEIHPDPERGLDLVLLDMDGTLVDGMSSWEWIHDHFGVSNLKNWERYQRGEIDDEEFMRSDIELWTAQGNEVRIEDIHEILRRAPLMRGAKEMVAALREDGIATAIMSGGLDILAARVAEETGIDMYVANGIEHTDEGYLTGDSYCFVRINDKAAPTRDLIQALGVDPARVAGVGNSRWDAGMFRECGLGIAFNPFDEEVKAAADVVIVEKDLRLCLPHLAAYGERGGPP